MNSNFVCLFWLSDDYKEVTETNGKIDFSFSDLQNKKTIDPIGMHDKYRVNPHQYNRGRVSLVNGRIELMIGKNCPNESLNNIIQYFGLNQFPIEVIRTGMYDK